MAAVATERRRFRLAEFLALTDELGLAGVQEWFELIGGELVAHASPRSPCRGPVTPCADRFSLSLSCR